MKFIRISIIVILVGVFAIALIPKHTKTYLSNAPKVATGLAAKLSCSAHYVSGFSKQQAIEDNISYSDILKWVQVDFHPADKSVTASIYGLAKSVAYFREGYGCSYQTALPKQDPSDKLVNSSTAPWPLGTHYPDVDPKAQKRVDAWVQKDNNENLNTRAIVVIKDGKLIAQSYAQGATNITPLLGWSMAKSLTSTLIGNAALYERIDLNKTALRPEWRDDRANISYPQLLTMTSGLKFTETYQPGDNATTMLFQNQNMPAYAADSKLIHKPGEIFSYSSGTSNILMQQFQLAVGGKLNIQNDYIFSHLYKPAGMANAYFETDPTGHFVGSSYWYASAPDWARLGLIWINNGVINGQRILSQDYIKSATAPNTSSNEACYGYQLWLNRGCDQLRWPDLPKDAYAMMGNREQFVMIIPSANTVIVRLGWTSTKYPTNERIAHWLK